MKFVMGGLAGLELDYIEDMRTWFEKNRSDKKFAADVLNFHCYAWKSKKGWEGGGPPKSPEEADFKQQLEEIIDYRNSKLPGTEVWVSEFGWDTNPESPLCAPAIGPFDIQEVQAQWLVRSYLAFAAAGVDRAQMYMLRDVDPKSGIWYSSCGLLGPKGDWTPKKSWYYVYTMKNILQDMYYDGEETAADPNVLIYKFKNRKSGQRVYAIWCKTSSNYISRNFKLSIGELKTVEKIELIPGKTNGISAPLKTSQKSILLDVTERPTFIRLSK
jgi:hypothetical protein